MAPWKEADHVSLSRLSALVLLAAWPIHLFAQALPGTKLLEQKADWARVMLDGIDRYLDRETAESVKHRQDGFKPDLSSPEAFSKSLEPKRQRLRKLLGLVDERVPMTGLEYVATTTRPSLLAETENFKV